MSDRAYRIAHVVQAVEEANKVIVLRRIGLGGLDLEPPATAKPGTLCGLARGRDRPRMIVEAKEARVRKCLRHQPRRDAVSAADVGDLGAALQLFNNAVKGGQPFLHQVVLVAGAEETRGAAEQAFAAPVPADALAGLERLGNLRFVEKRRRDDVTDRAQEDGTVFV